MRIGEEKIVSLLAGLLFLSVISCSIAVEPKEIPPPEPPQPTPSPQALDLPDDDGSHDAPIEWWYYNGHLEAEDGSEYSFHFVIFQTQSAGDDSQFNLGQAGITDVNHSKHMNISSFGSIQAKDAADVTDTHRLGLDLGNFSLGIGVDGAHSLVASDEESGSAIHLQTAPPTDVMLHEGVGWMDWPFGWTYYYSYPRMKSDGIIIVRGQEKTVSGEVWFDHQWGDFFVLGKPAGWQWFALHLDDGRSLMVSEVRGGDGQVAAIDGTLVSERDGQRVLDALRDGISVDVLHRWISPGTGGDYPSGWRLTIESIGLDVVLDPTVKDQEVSAMPYGNQAAAYWEGRADVIDASSGEHLGLAFVELSGYVDPEPLIWRDKLR